MFEPKDPYENDKVRQLRAEWQMIVDNANNKYSEEISRERQREKDSRKWDYKMIWLFILYFVLLCVALPINHWLFSPTSIFSWTYWHQLVNHYFPNLF